MKTTRLIILLSTCSVRLFAQDADSATQRKLLTSLPPLTEHRVELKANPPLMFVGISAVATDKSGKVYVLDRPADGDPVVVLDRNGNVLRSWGKGMFKIPHGIRIDPAGNVWTVDAHTSVIYKFSALGKKLLEIDVGGVPDSTEDFCGASDITFGPDGRLFVADGYCNARVIEYDSTGRKVKQWGRPGTGPGEFDVPHSIIVGPGGNLYVADRENGRVQWFDLDGKFLGQRTYGGQLYTVAFNTAGEMFVCSRRKGVSDDVWSLIKVDRESGKMLSRVAVRCHELTIDSHGTLIPATRSSQLLFFTR